MIIDFHIEYQNTDGVCYTASIGDESQEAAMAYFYSVNPGAAVISVNEVARYDEHMPECMRPGFDPTIYVDGYYGDTHEDLAE